MNNLKIELTPYNAIAILHFAREFINDDNKNDPQFKAIHEAVDQFSDEIVSKITVEQLEDHQAENEVNQMIGKSPKVK